MTTCAFSSKARNRRRQRTRRKTEALCAKCSMRRVFQAQRKCRLNCPKRMNPRLKSTLGQAQTLRRVWHRTTISSRGSGFPARTWIIRSSGRATPEHYLHHTFTGKQGAAGTLFSLMKTDYSIPSRNIAIYGHHLKSTGEKMFTSLMRYKDADFYAGHETVLLDTLYESGIIPHFRRAEFSQQRVGCFTGGF